LYKNPPKTVFFGKPTIYLPTCHSTNDYATELIGNSVVSEGTAIITDHQFLGKGQRGNTWQTDSHQNLTITYILKPTFLQSDKAFQLYVAIALAVIKTLEILDGPHFKIKWPNDIYHKEYKLGGILIENSIRKQQLTTACVGIGLNINQTSFGGLQATSLKRITNRTYLIQEVFNELSSTLETYYLKLRQGHHEQLKDTYHQYLYWMNEMHDFHDGKRFRGVIRGIDGNGRLLIESEKGIEPFNFQQVKFLQ
jgi:BirA family biotin operon repressor/biotin-[acetyl-CoA-carboxylase] ligase